MQYREFGNTQEKISILGMGCMRLPKLVHDGKEEIDLELSELLLTKAYEKGITYFDCAPAYCNSQCESIVGKAVKRFRNEIMISSKIPLQEVKEKGDYDRWLERSLDALGTEYLDNYLFWGINKDLFEQVILPLGLLKEGAKAKEKGLIRRMSLSVHDSPENILYMINRAKEEGHPFDSILCQYNLLDQKNEEVIAYAKRMGMGTMVMGPVAGGRLAWPSHLGEKLGEENVPTSELALRFVMENEQVDCTLSGMSSLEMVEENSGLAEQIQKRKTGLSSSEAIRKLEKLNQLYCTGCGYCQACPMDIKISKILYLVNCVQVYGLEQYAKHEFEDICKKYGIPHEKCMRCGKCEAKCPQRLKITEELEKAFQLLSSIRENG